ncbi:hypothetical protein DFJ74DRAFT_713319 [Hyaloraphidium curvatum]|nr:hypothetical protein DFJ74DRAFT_713319 [Hyaloraphidium curvatum]
MPRPHARPPLSAACMILPPVLVLLAAALADGAPAPHVLIRRSCADCSSEFYCEYSHPDAPPDTVACVRYPEEGGHRLLYRSYGDPCGSSPCLHGGTCVLSGAPSGYTCICTEQYAGTNCELASCSGGSQICSNGGTCVGKLCVCASGFSGPYCQTYTPPSK